MIGVPGVNRRISRSSVSARRTCFGGAFRAVVGMRCPRVEKPVGCGKSPPWPCSTRSTAGNAEGSWVDGRRIQRRRGSSRRQDSPKLLELSPTPSPTSLGLARRRYGYLGCALADGPDGNGSIVYVNMKRQTLATTGNRSPAQNRNDRSLTAKHLLIMLSNGSVENVRTTRSCRRKKRFRRRFESDWRLNQAIRWEIPQ